MKKFIGTKIVEAEPMNRGEYNTYRGWQIPKDENPADEGYHIRIAPVQQNNTDNQAIYFRMGAFEILQKDIIVQKSPGGNLTSG